MRSPWGLDSQLAAEAQGLLDPAAGAEGLSRLEGAIRTVMIGLGGGLLGRLLAADRGHRGTRIDCDHGHQADFVGYRSKHVDTVLGPVTLNRAWYHCSDCHAGIAPRDVELGVAGASLSPGLRRMVARTAASEPFAQARKDLAELAGIQLTVKRLERSAEADGQTVAAAVTTEAAAVLTGTLSSLHADREPLDTLYVALDGTGVPCVPRRGRRPTGKHPDGRARTREVKLGCVFTQTGTDADGRPVRDPDSTSYTATFAPAETFGTLFYAEARRRGVDRATRLIRVSNMRSLYLTTHDLEVVI